MANPPNPNPMPIRRVYHLNFETRYFVCRICRTPVLLPIDSLGPIEGELHGPLCDNAFNVKICDTTIHRFIHNLPVYNVHCKDCNRHIGEKFIAAGENDPPRPYPLEGKVFFYSNKLLFWDGIVFLAADTGETVRRLIYFDGTQLRYTGTAPRTVPYPDEETNEGTADQETKTDDEETEIETVTETKVEDS